MLNEDVNIKIFDNWAIHNKDVGMEKEHAYSVEKMINVIKRTTNIFNSKFDFLDLGCGNGWVVKNISKHKHSNLCVGVDASYNMIKKAKNNNPDVKFYQSKIENFSLNHKFDIIFSMETLYYLNNIELILNKLHNQFLSNNGLIIIGIDHYTENTPSLSWEKEIGIRTKTLTISEWINQFDRAGFKNINYMQVGMKNDWAGTLIIYANK